MNNQNPNNNEFEDHSLNNILHKYMKAKPIKSQQFNSDSEKLRDLTKFFLIAEEMSPASKHPLIEIMSAKKKSLLSSEEQQQIQERKVAIHDARMTQLEHIRSDARFETIGQLLNMTSNFMSDFIKEFSGAYQADDFVRRAKEIHGRIRFEFKTEKR
jgi:hypothetical protein